MYVVPHMQRSFLYIHLMLKYGEMQCFRSITKLRFFHFFMKIASAYMRDTRTHSKIVTNVQQRLDCDQVIRAVVVFMGFIIKVYRTQEKIILCSNHHFISAAASDTNVLESQMAMISISKNCISPTLYTEGVPNKIRKMV